MIRPRRGANNVYVHAVIYVWSDAAVLNFSDPVEDPSFRSKAIVAGTLILGTVVQMGLGVSDSWLYFEQWEYKGHQIILQVRF